MRLDHIPPFKTKKVLRAVIETPKGSRNKYNYDPETKAVALAKAPHSLKVEGQGKK